VEGAQGVRAAAVETTRRVRHWAGSSAVDPLFQDKCRAGPPRSGADRMMRHEARAKEMATPRSETVRGRDSLRVSGGRLTSVKSRVVGPTKGQSAIDKGQSETLSQRGSGARETPLRTASGGARGKGWSSTGRPLEKVEALRSRRPGTLAIRSPRALALFGSSSCGWTVGTLLVSPRARQT
jgi:hypothetical protein